MNVTESSADDAPPGPEGSDRGDHAAELRVEELIPAEKFIEEQFSGAAFSHGRKRRFDEYEEAAAQADYPTKLKESGRSYLEAVGPLEAGELVQWKPTMKSQRFPAYGRPAVVIGPTPRQAAPSFGLFDAPGSEVLDLYIGVLDGDLDFVIFRVDSRRLQRFVEE